MCFGCIKKAVAGKRNGLVWKGNNLDICHITDRIIVMSFPASDLGRKMFRNDASQVRDYFDETYGDNYMVVNVSETPYDAEVFHGRVIQYNWPDHHGPPLYYMLPLVKKMSEHLMASKDNVIAIHCKGGKGRAGTACCLLLAYMNYFDNLQDCAKLFSV